MTRQRFVGVVIATVLGWPAAWSSGASPDPVMSRSTAFGIDARRALYRYDMGTGQLVTVGPITFENGQALGFVTASGYFPHFQHLHAVWIDPADQESKVIQIDTETGQARATGISFGEGPATGAAAVVTGGADGTAPAFRLFVVQLRPNPANTPAIRGQINITPDENADGEFWLMTGSRTITGDDLKKNVPVNSLGVAYEGSATSLHVRPKCRGRQQGLRINGQPYSLNNSQSFDVSGSLTVRLFNDHLDHSKPIGKWWISVEAAWATVKVDGTPLPTSTAPVPSTSRLLAMHTQIGLGTVVMQLSRAYEGLGTRDGRVFYSIGIADNKLYRIDTAQGAETEVGTLPGNVKVTDFDFLGSALVGFDALSNRLVTVDTGTAAVETYSEIATPGLLTISFTLTADVPRRRNAAVD